MIPGASASQGGVERLKQLGGVAAAALVKGDLLAQVLDLHSLHSVQRASLGSDQQPERRI